MQVIVGDTVGFTSSLYSGENNRVQQTVTMSEALHVPSYVNKVW